ncbi:MAG TPA: ABC transporter ATP-binding protein, partial [Chitinophagaceae bacterium]|nr:ABC transporter ATP-binding protein [Chitinophagaceae bacterium]
MAFPLLHIEDLSIAFESEDETVTAVKNISFSLNRNEILAVVGESGSGKSVTALSMLQLLPSPPTKYPTGRVLFSENGESQQDILKLDGRELQLLRGNKIAMIFQEPMSSLNPVIRCGHQLTEALLQHQRINGKEAREIAIEWFNKVKLPNPEKILDRYPHQLSGGQKQRVMIAMAMSCRPSLLICDEPTTALDVTVQKQILLLIKELQQELKMGVLFITHDLGVVAELADRALIMYKGSIIEENTIASIFKN